jgi:hypothetical protein
MNTQDVTKDISTISLGDHVACIYRTTDELFSFLIPFYISGLEQHNKCVFTLNGYSPADVVGKFKASGFDLAPYIAKQEFIFLSTASLYVMNNQFLSGPLISLLRDQETVSLNQKFAGLRIIEDGAWVGSNQTVLSDLMKYEAKVSEFIDESSIVAACLYKESLFESRVLVDVLRTHPNVFLYDTLLDNKYFSASDNFMTQIDNPSNAFDYQRMIQTLPLASTP